jgi:parallel beta-helix repeat protein
LPVSIPTGIESGTGCRQWREVHRQKTGARGGLSSEDGVKVLGNPENTTIRNGSAVAWGESGIDALTARLSRFEDLHLGYNDQDGIRVSSTDTILEGNTVTDNDWGGIVVTSSGCLVVKNRAAGNLTNYFIVNVSAYGPIVNVTGAGNIANIANPGHPLANLAY